MERTRQGGGGDDADAVLGQTGEALDLTEEIAGPEVLEGVGTFMHGPFHAGHLAGENDKDMGAVRACLDKGMLRLNVNEGHIVLDLFRAVAEQKLHIVSLLRRKRLKDIHRTSPPYVLIISSNSHKKKGHVSYFSGVFSESTPWSAGVYQKACFLREKEAGLCLQL